MEYIHKYTSVLGHITLASDGENLTGLWFDGQRHYARGLDPCHEAKALPVFDLAERWLDTYFSGREPDFTPPLNMKGTAFQRAVWACLMEIPYGATATYGAIAARMGVPNTSARAFGGAVGRNPISLIVPCHRVVGADGSLTGYAGGLERKQRLLALEKADLQFPDRLWKENTI